MEPRDLLRFVENEDEKLRNRYRSYVNEEGIIFARTVKRFWLITRSRENRSWKIFNADFARALKSRRTISVVEKRNKRHKSTSLAK